MTTLCLAPIEDEDPSRLRGRLLLLPSVVLFTF